MRRTIRKTAASDSLRSRMRAPFRTASARFFGVLATCTALIYLSIALGSDPLTQFLGVDAVPGTLEGNLAGSLGALLAFALRHFWGVLYLLPLVALGYLATALLWPQAPSRVLRILGVGFVSSSLFAVTLSALSLLRAPERASGWGGMLGDTLYHLIVNPLGVMGAMILPAVLAIALVATQIDYERLDEAVNLTARGITGSFRSTLRMLQGVFFGVSYAGRKSAALARKASELTTERFASAPAGALPAEQETLSPPPSWLVSEEVNTTPEAAGIAEESPWARSSFPLARAPESAPEERVEDPIEETVTPESVPASWTARLMSRIAKPAGTTARNEPGTWMPPLDLFRTVEKKATQNEDQEVRAMGENLMGKLREFKGLDGELIGHTIGPSVLCMHVRPAPGVPVASFEKREADLALALGQEAARITTISEKKAVGIEIARPNRQMVTFRELMESPEFRDGKNLLPIALGKDIAGRTVVTDLAKMPHLLIAGTTGSGKSVAMNVLLGSLIVKYSPDELRLILVDPKQVEMSGYRDLPHLRHPVITDPSEAVLVLKWAVKEMEHRYSLLSARNAKNLVEWERKRLAWSPDEATDDVEAPPKLPYIVIVVDEFADLIMTSKNEVEQPIARLAQKARAVGIHVVLATQRPTQDIVTGLIKGNIPTRIAFRVFSKNDSRIILDQNGADQLIGNGDMLFIPPGKNIPIRVQGAYVDTEETEGLVRWCAEHWVGEERAEEDILDAVRREQDSPEEEADEAFSDELDPLFDKAVELCAAEGNGSTSFLQRKMKIGYGRAARIVDQLRDAGVLDKPNGSKASDFLGYPNWWVHR